MPLSKVRKPTKAHCRANVSKNIKTLMAEGRPQPQAVAIALSVARKAGCRVRKQKLAGHSIGRAPNMTVHRIAVLDDEKHGMRAFVYEVRGGGRVYGYQATLQDIDSGMMLPTTFVSENKDDVIAKAERWVGKHAGHASGHADRLFIGVYPGGIVYSDRRHTEHGDYKRVAFLPYDTLRLSVHAGAPKSLVAEVKRHAEAVIARRGGEFEVSAAGQKVRLGHASGKKEK